MRREVALRKESVDRNFVCPGAVPADSVALRKESVDRNGVRGSAICRICYVALRKESVDRNYRQRQCGQGACGRSPQGERG